MKDPDLENGRVVLYQRSTTSDHMLEHPSTHADILPRNRVCRRRRRQEHGRDDRLLWYTTVMIVSGALFLILWRKTPHDSIAWIAFVVWCAATPLFTVKQCSHTRYPEMYLVTSAILTGFCIAITPTANLPDGFPTLTPAWTSLSLWIASLFFRDRPRDRLA